MAPLSFARDRAVDLEALAAELDPEGSRGV